MTFYTICPIVRRSTEAFQQWVVIGGDRQKATFTKDILWLLESESVVQFIHGGEVLMEGRRHNDYYGLLSSMDISENGLGVHEVAKKYEITRDSSMSLVVATRIYERPVVETEETIAHNKSHLAERRAQYAELPDEWRQERSVGGETVWSRLGEIDLATEIVWSSKNDTALNNQLRESFVQRWKRSELPR